MSSRKALGKGLGALIPEARGELAGRLKICGIEEIKPNPYQPRREFAADELQGLADSIRHQGILVPLLVQRRDDHFELIAGERRWRASQLAGLKEVPVLIKEGVSPVESLGLALVENLQRKNLNPLEEAEAYQQLAQEFNLTQEEISRRIGKDRATVANQLRLLRLPNDVKNFLRSGELSAGHARALLALDEERLIREAAVKIIKKGLSVRETESLVKKEQGRPSSRKPASKSSDPQTKALQEEMTRALGTKVAIKSGAQGKGKIEIEFYSNDDLTRLVEILLEKASF